MPTILNESYTYDDVLLVPQYSEILPKEVKLHTKLTPQLSLNLPFISADMDTVTEGKMAIAMARAGGIGIIHKNMTEERQAEEIAIVKRTESGVISDPITLSPEEQVSVAQDLMKRYGISGIPITRDKKVVGMLTRRDLRFIEDGAILIADVMTDDVVTAPVGTSLEEAKQLLQEYRIEKVPLINETGELKGMITIRDIQNQIDFPHASKDEKGRLLVGASIGVGDGAMKRLDLLVDAGLDVAVISTAHGNSKGVIETVSRVKKEYPDLPIIAGNVIDGDAVKALADAGADTVKVGVGPGSICTTRVVAGVGVPQFSAVLECSEVGRELGVPIIADGGIRYSGDAVKALAAGASTIMAGGLFAGTDEAPGEVIHYKGESYKVYRGMGSEGALQTGSKERYGQQGSSAKKLVPEGVEGQVKYRGTVSDILFQFAGGLKSGCGYLGAKDLEALQERAKFVPITAASLKESHPHDIFITKEASNYQA